MTGVLVMFGGILVVCGIITLLDWLARRKERQAEHRPPA